MTQLIISSAYYKLLIGGLCTLYALMNSLSFLVAKFRNILTYVSHLKLTICHRYVIREKLKTKGLLKSSLNLKKTVVKYLKITIMFPLLNIKCIVIYITDLFALLKQLTIVNKLNSIEVIYQKHEQF